ncbi:MAG TPA: excinuclease ABC subunit UvrC [Acidiferrobacteraceae bacterium]|nr:excinuclease ABC subunit UvrC [Acidiferrobacteraceae bacterium]
MTTELDPKQLLDSISHAPGVYRMLDSEGAVLYVGKARDLNKRVASYFHKTGLGAKTQVLMTQVRDVDVIVTHTEAEALLLENNFIKSLKPRYNILLRDDKSYPYIYLSVGHKFPFLSFHRGPHKRAGRYFGPYPNAGAVRESLTQLQRTFPVRQCKDSYFKNRSRPCLQYQIKRCTAPCVDLISEQNYAEDVRQATLFLEGKSESLVNELVVLMETASQTKNYEQAALLRDRIANLRHVQERQYVSTESGDVDVVALTTQAAHSCIQLSCIRAGQHVGSKSFFPTVPLEPSREKIMSAFLEQHYIDQFVPGLILINSDPTDMKLLGETLSAQSEHKVVISHPSRGQRARWVEMAALNAKESLHRHMLLKSTLRQQFEQLIDVLALEAAPDRIECVDVSHTMGEATVASCVVYDRDGPLKEDYRRYNIEGIEPGDDYGAVTQMLNRRFRRLTEEDGKLPDLLIIDGGKGQLSAAKGVLDEFQIDGVKLIAIAKGAERKPGKEQIFLSPSSRPIILGADSPALHLIQQIRDEAHRFAISGHRQRRSKARVTSTLEHIAGVGSKRRQALLKHLGGLQGVRRAGVEDLRRVPGISPILAQRIYDEFNS